MTSTPTPDSPAGGQASAGGADRRLARVTVRYWAAARAAAGRETDVVAGGSVRDVVDAARAAHADRPGFARVLEVSSLLLRDEPLGTRCLADVAVADGDTLEVLPPFAGG